MQDHDLSILEMFGCLYEDLDIDKIEEKFVELVNSVFSFDRTALFFVKHKKEMLTGKLAKGFNREIVRTIEVPIKSDSLLVKPLITGIPLRHEGPAGDPYTELLGLKRFAMVPIVNKKRAACWEINNCGERDCPAHGKRWVRCWLVSGTKCGDGNHASLADKSLQCSMCPIFTAQNHIEAVEGVMLVDNSLTDKPIPDDVVTILSIIAHTVGMAINNSKLYQRTLDVSIRDALTDLHNRRYFNERLLDEVERARRYNEPLSLIICDIDHFKRVNDTHGHPVGDTVLRWVSDVLRNTLRKNDVISRYGGEEFATVLLNTDKVQALEIAEKLRGAFAGHPFKHCSIDVAITLSFGVAVLGTDSRTFEGLVAQADKALYRAKANGRNRVCTC